MENCSKKQRCTCDKCDAEQTAEKTQITVKVAFVIN